MEPTKFWINNRKSEITISVIQSNFGKILGAYCPIKFEKFNGYREIKKGNCFLYFFDDDEMRICPSKGIGKDVVYSDWNYPYGFSKAKNSLYI